MKTYLYSLIVSGESNPSIQIVKSHTLTLNMLTRVLSFASTASSVVYLGRATLLNHDAHMVGYRLADLVTPEEFLAIPNSMSLFSLAGLAKLQEEWGTAPPGYFEFDAARSRLEAARRKASRSSQLGQNKKGRK